MDRDGSTLCNDSIFEDFYVDRVKKVGGESQGSEYYSVYKFEHKDTRECFYIKFSGTYASHYGSDYDSCDFVEAKEQTITVYE